MAKKQKKGRPVKPVVPRIKDFPDRIAPAAVKFNTDSYVLGSSFRCTPALRSYPTTTKELALLCHLDEKSGVGKRQRKDGAQEKYTKVYVLMDWAERGRTASPQFNRRVCRCPANPPAFSAPA